MDQGKFYICLTREMLEQIRRMDKIIFGSIDIHEKKIQIKFSRYLVRQVFIGKKSYIHQMFLPAYIPQIQRKSEVCWDNLWDVATAGLNPLLNHCLERPLRRAHSALYDPPERPSSYHRLGQEEPCVTFLSKDYFKELNESMILQNVRISNGRDGMSPVIDRGSYRTVC